MASSSTSVNGSTSKSETAAAFVATVRESHDAMTAWYNASTPQNQARPQHATAFASIKQRFGRTYPSVWKEVLNWPGWNETRQLYLDDTQNQSTSSTSSQIKSEPTTTNSTSTDVTSTITRKRKSRWGNASEDTAAAASSATTNNHRSGNTNANGNTNNGNFNSNTNNNNSNNNDEVAQWQAQLRQLNQRIDAIPAEAARVDALPRHHRDRSPSPPPIYGPDGKRQNTRAVRWKERYTAQRQDLLEKLLQHSATSGKMGALLGANLASGMHGNSSFSTASTPLALLRPTKTMRKIPIPIEKHPNYNFIGLIIGPRGKTQKELEAKTGCKIAIRGKGSVKEGARGRRDGVQEAGDFEPLHVVVSGDDPRAVEAASTMISDMLVVIDDERNVHKQQQLRELALLNGTLKDDESNSNVHCPICAEKGHRAFECPKRFSQNARNNRGPGGGGGPPGSGGPGGGFAVKCAICGDTSHPTRDCKQTRPPGMGGSTAPGANAVDAQQVDSDYQSFMAELDGGGKPPPTLPPPVAALPLPPPPMDAAPMAPPSGPPPPGLLPPPLPPHGVGGGSLPPPPPPPTASLPPPPPPQASYPAPPPPYHGHAPPPPPQQQSYYGHQQPQPGYQQQQQHPNHSYHQYGGNHNGAPPDANGHHPNGAAAPPPQQQQQQQQYQQVAPGEETAAWDPNAYYGGGNNAGALNWWEQ